MGFLIGDTYALLYSTLEVMVLGWSRDGGVM